MTLIYTSRRNILKAATTLAAASSIAGIGASKTEAAESNAAARSPALGQVDQSLRQAVNDQTVGGVVAIGANDKGIVYEGAFGPGVTADSIFWIASMTKAITATAGMQLVEQGKLSLDGPVPAIDPGLARPQVFTGFDAAGKPMLRPAKRAITLRHLLTHTAGFCDEQWNPDLARCVAALGMPQMASGKLAALRMPLMFDPGERWEYGINTDRVGRLVEEVSGQKLDAYFAEHITGPLGMVDTGFRVSAEQRARQASVHQRHPDNRLEPQPLEQPIEREFLAGGGGLYSTAGDYLTFLRALLHEGALSNRRILKPETVVLMCENHIYGLTVAVGVLRTNDPSLTNDVDLFPGRTVGWGLGFMLTPEPGPDGRGAGSVNWGAFSIPITGSIR
jgi:methyl acetate hydrolase